MIEETATVIAVNGDRVTVKSTIKSSCHGCQQQDECGSGQVAKAIPHKSLVTNIDGNSALSLSVGDEVVIGLSEKSMLKSALSVYLWPLISLILGAAIGQYLFVLTFGWHELTALALALSASVIGFKIAKNQQSQHAVISSLEPKLLKKCDNTIPVTQI